MLRVPMCAFLIDDFCTYTNHQESLGYAFFDRGVLAGKSKPPPIHITAEPKKKHTYIIWNKNITYSYILYPNPYHRKMALLCRRQTNTV